MLSFDNGFLWFLLGDKQPLPWEMRVRVAYYIAQALDHCNTENRKIYHDLNAYRILFDEVCLWICNEESCYFIQSIMNVIHMPSDYSNFVCQYSFCLSMYAFGLHICLSLILVDLIALFDNFVKYSLVHQLVMCPHSKSTRIKRLVYLCNHIFI